MDGENPPAWRVRLEQLADAHGFDANMRRRLVGEVLFSQTYLQNFAHGTDGHIRLVLIALLSELLMEEQG